MTSRHGVLPIACDFEHVYAFDITGDLDADGMRELADTLSNAFDIHDGKINILFRFNDFEATDAGNTGLVGFGTQLRSLTNVARYATVGAPEGAGRMIAFFDKLIPVEAKSFDKNDEQAAWNFVNERV